MEDGGWQAPPVGGNGGPPQAPTARPHTSLGQRPRWHPINVMRAEGPPKSSSVNLIPFTIPICVHPRLSAVQVPAAVPVRVGRVFRKYPPIWDNGGFQFEFCPADLKISG